MSRITETIFGQLSDGRDVVLFVMTNNFGASMSVTNYGAIITSLSVPDREGHHENVVLHYPSLAEYQSDTAYMGAFVGRFANRLASGRFTLDGQAYQLPCNDGVHHLHGGLEGFSKRLWTAETRQTDKGPQIVLTLNSPDGDQGFPGELTVTLIYTLTDNNAVEIDVSATTTKPTVVNFTQHSYFNLSAGADPNVLDHELMIHADHVLETDHDLIPTGRLLEVDGTAFDFKTFRTMGERIDDSHLTQAHGYDHNFVLTNEDSPVAILRHRRSGRQLSVLSNQPGMQLYSGNHLGGPLSRHAPRSAVCLETQHFPDSPNHPSFPSTVLLPNETYYSRTVYQFGLMDA